MYSIVKLHWPNADETINQQLATHVQVFNASRYAVTHDKKGAAIRIVGHRGRKRKWNY